MDVWNDTKLRDYPIGRPGRRKISCHMVVRIRTKKTTWHSYMVITCVKKQLEKAIWTSQMT